MRDALLRPDEKTLATLAAAGPGAVLAFRDWLAGDLDLDLPRGLGRDFGDQVQLVSDLLAERFPGEYVAAFDEPRWRSTSWVISGLGRTGSPAVRPLLVALLRSREPELVRLHAAIALRHVPGADTVAALLDVLDDPEYLVRYHAIESLGAVGDERVLARLLPLAADPPNRGIGAAAAAAVRAISDRVGATAPPTPG